MTAALVAVLFSAAVVRPLESRLHVVLALGGALCIGAVLMSELVR